MANRKHVETQLHHAAVEAQITHGYFVYLEYKKNGQTPGKRLFGLRVVTLDGSPLSLGKCLTREAIRYVDMLFVLQ